MTAFARVLVRVGGQPSGRGVRAVPGPLGLGIRIQKPTVSFYQTNTIATYVDLLRGFRS
jgi:hypothetical protein